LEDNKFLGVVVITSGKSFCTGIKPLKKPENTDTMFFLMSIFVNLPEKNIFVVDM